MIPHQLSTINSVVLSAAYAHPLNKGLPRRKQSIDNDLDQCDIQRKEIDINICTENPSRDDCTKSTCSSGRHSCKADHHQKEISFKLGSTEVDNTSQQHSHYVTTLGAVKIELPAKEESMTKL